MNWNVICRVGENDNYSIDEKSEPLPLYLAFERPRDPNSVRNHVVEDLVNAYGIEPSNTVKDLLSFGMSVYAADRLIPRNITQDGWTRKILLHHPVTELLKWEKQKICLQETLSFLTGDNWTLEFRQKYIDDLEFDFDTDIERPEQGRVILCSGGADSLAGAIMYAERGEKLYLVGHHGGGLTPKFQHAVMNGLKDAYDEQVNVHSFYAVPPQLPGPGESTMRSRSILFITIGLVVADIVGSGTSLSIPENGLISLNIPLTTPRSGSASTRTTHPHFISGMRDIIKGLAIPHSIELPFRFHTKGEMFLEASSKILNQLLSKTMSCSHPETSRWEGKSPGTHCGYCVPCLIRRAAVKKAKLSKYDADYIHDVRDGSPDPSGNKGSDLRALRMSLARLKNGTEKIDFIRILNSGPIPLEDIKQYASVYRRGMIEVAEMLQVKL